MFVDAAVEQRKFERELDVLGRNAERLASLGIWMVRSSGREIDLVCVPRLAVRIAFPMQGLLPGFAPGALPVGIPLQVFDFPSLAGRAFGIRLDLAGYDQRAPSLTFCDPWSWEPLPITAIPLGLLADDPTKLQQVVLDAHPVTKRPFLCMRGVREYHEHPQHDGDDWALYRGSINVYALLDRLARITLSNVRPQILFVPTAPGQVALQLNWIPP
jgi:hypothetical protein